MALPKQLRQLERNLAALAKLPEELSELRNEFNKLRVTTTEQHTTTTMRLGALQERMGAVGDKLGAINEHIAGPAVQDCYGSQLGFARAMRSASQVTEVVLPSSARFTTAFSGCRRLCSSRCEERKELLFC